jgi:hypothetical protein
MATDKVSLSGTLSKLKPEDAVRLSAYIVRGKEVLAHTTLQPGGQINLTLSQSALASTGAHNLEIVIGPAGAEKQLDSVPNLQRIPIDPSKVDKNTGRLALPIDKLNVADDILKAWWLWIRHYCVSGVVVGPDGCPAPFAVVTVYSVSHTSGGGFSKTPRATVTTKADGSFTACFNQRAGFCWPCWPFWWLCWPWWWEWDILHVIQSAEKTVKTVPHVGPGDPVTRIAALPAVSLAKPATKELMRGQAFPAARKSDRLVPDANRTALIKSKLADPRFREVFPWWWWCCDDPNIIFTVTQGANTILQEDPAKDTRWCLEEDSKVKLVGNASTITVCSGDPKPAHGFVWTRVGNTTVDHINHGYADGAAGSDASDLAFFASPDIYGEFAPAANVAFYQVNAGVWGGSTANPSRGGTQPASHSPISAELWNTAVILHNDGTVTFTSVKMGPFSAGSQANLYATQEHRKDVPAGSLPPFTPAATDAVFWAFNGRKVNTDSANLNGGAVAGVDLTVTAYDLSVTEIHLPPNTDDKLTLMIDNTPLTAHINGLTAYSDPGETHPVTSTGAGTACPAYLIGPNAHVKLNVTVQDDNGHLYAYRIEPDFGHGSVGVAEPGRGYRTPAGAFPFPPLPYQPPNTAAKSFGGGTEDIKFTPTVDCCYDFRLNVGKRVTDGTNGPTWFTADFQTATLKVTP